jgi:peptidoglycan-N-acetylglucosamine deacetylase
MVAKKSSVDSKKVRKVMLTDLTVGVFLTILFTLVIFALINSRTLQITGDLAARVETDEKVVALTFDDGPLPGKTQAILDVLERQDVKATFFLIGREVEKNPRETQAIIDAGHELGNHTYHHYQMVFKPSRFIKNDIEKTDALFREYGYTAVTTVRPPYGDKLIELPRYLQAHDRTTVMWDVESDEDGDTASIKNNIVSRVRPGSIVLLHPMYDHRAASLNAIEPSIVSLKEKGYRFVTITELLKERGK